MDENNTPYSLLFGDPTPLDNINFLDLFNGTPDEYNIFMNCLLEDPNVNRTNDFDIGAPDSPRHGPAHSMNIDEPESVRCQAPLCIVDEGAVKMAEGDGNAVAVTMAIVSNSDQGSTEWRMDLARRTPLLDWTPSAITTSEATLENIASEEGQHSTSSTVVSNISVPPFDNINTLLSGSSESAMPAETQDCSLCSQHLYSNAGYHLRTHQHGKACHKGRNKENIGPPATTLELSSFARTQSLPNLMSSNDDQPEMKENPGWFAGNAMDSLPLDGDFAEQVIWNLSMPRNARPQGCAGVKLEWTPGPIFDTFPWQLMRDQKDALGFHITHIKGTGDDAALWLKSSTCLEKANLDGSCCNNCSVIPDSKVLRNASARARDAAPAHTNYEYLNHQQMHDKLTNKGVEKQSALKEILHLASRLSTAHGRLDDHKWMVEGLANSDVK
ncbi:hypothetical protein BDN71DRAFT_1505745 [Pleurotus eryngii]|uniref:Uncharacterized protein n=1 Tax=Pleurotus eryngii TaxID=5323 RepID=A0A9P6A0H4_PLEER|nr:hypothetical protein BDN71DRAFT_1505745 [Pleurotus eryngii]